MEVEAEKLGGMKDDGKWPGRGENKGQGWERMKGARRKERGGKGRRTEKGK